MKLYTIKPLEWKPGMCGMVAKTLVGNFYVWPRPDGKWLWAPENSPEKRCDSLADGQAQAEACWQARLAGVLEEQR